jgi:transcription initiation factor TFIID TATA-box-binding protein
MADLKIENIVGNIQVARTLDLEKIFEFFPNTKYDPDEAPSLVVKFDDPKSVVMIFKNGKVVFSGIKRFEDTEKIKSIICDKLNHSGIKTYKDPEIKIQNIITSTDIENEINLSKIVKSINKFQYNPEEFPGLVYISPNQNTVILLFHSGKIIGNGIELEEISTTIDRIMEEITSVK